MPRGMEGARIGLFPGPGRDRPARRGLRSSLRRRPPTRLSPDSTRRPLLTPSGRGRRHSGQASPSPPRFNGRRALSRPLKTELPRTSTRSLPQFLGEGQPREQSVAPESALPSRPVNVWTLIEGTAAGFPGLAIAGKGPGRVAGHRHGRHAGHRPGQGAAPTRKKGTAPSTGAWCANSRECLAMLLHSGNAGSNTFADHREYWPRQSGRFPPRSRNKVLVRIDGAGASHELAGHLLPMSSPRRKVLFTRGSMINSATRTPSCGYPPPHRSPALARTALSSRTRPSRRSGT
jgi:hypothetical protein